MKHLFPLVLLVFFVGCDQYSGTVQKPIDHARVRELRREIMTTLEYIPSSKVIKTREQVLLDGGGDCADLSALLGSYMIDEGLIPFEFPVWELEGESARHMNVRYDGVIYDLTFPDWTREGFTEVAIYQWRNVVATWVIQGDL